MFLVNFAAANCHIKWKGKYLERMPGEKESIESQKERDYMRGRSLLEIIWWIFFGVLMLLLIVLSVSVIIYLAECIRCNQFV